jgi:hypothetical protein
MDEIILQVPKENEKPRCKAKDKAPAPQQHSSTFDGDDGELSKASTEESEAVTQP